MILLLLALAGTPTAESAQATLQSCEMTPSGWVCHYQMPSVTIETPPGATVVPSAGSPISVTLPPPPSSDAEKAEAARQARLIARCADANWLSLCLPDDRREARRLRDAAVANAALRTRVTGLLSENRCSDAVTAALSGGDMALAREARAFCSP